VVPPSPPISGGEAADERQQLMTAAERVLARSGWWGFKVESVLKEARLSTRSFYRHFEGKNELLAALLEQDLLAIAGYVADGVDAEAPPVDRVWAYIDSLTGWAFDPGFAKPAILFAGCWREFRPLYPELIERCVDALTAPLVSALKEGHRLGSLCSPDANADAKAVFFLIGGALFDSPRRDDESAHEVLDRVVLPFIGRAFGIPRREPDDS
jgi:AcrR family transcriptional regulator